MGLPTSGSARSKLLSAQEQAFLRDKYMAFGKGHGLPVLQHSRGLVLPVHRWTVNNNWGQAWAQGPELGLTAWLHHWPRDVPSLCLSFYCRVVPYCRVAVTVRSSDMSSAYLASGSLTGTCHKTAEGAAMCEHHLTCLSLLCHPLHGLPSSFSLHGICFYDGGAERSPTSAREHP